MSEPSTERDARCPGCGRRFKSAKGLRVHRSARFVAMGCRPVRANAAEPAESSWCCERPGCDYDHRTARVVPPDGIEP